MSVWAWRAPSLEELLLAPQERVLWPILVFIGILALTGYWVGRKERGVSSKHGPTPNPVRAPDGSPPG